MQKENRKMLVEMKELKNQWLEELRNEGNLKWPNTYATGVNNFIKKLEEKGIYQAVVEEKPKVIVIEKKIVVGRTTRKKLKC